MPTTTQYTWTTLELDFLKDCVDDYTNKDRLKMWDSVCNKVNNRFHNCRTVNSCKRRHNLLIAAERRFRIQQRTYYDRTALKN